MNYQSWTGFSDIRFGYGSMLSGFIDNKPDDVSFFKKASVQVYMGVPFGNKGWFEGQHRALFTMWETDVLPSSFLRYIPKYDQILVPCKHNVELFSQHHSNVSYVPLGVDPTFWRPQQTSKNKLFQFRAGGSLWRRKGLDLVVQAFTELDLPDAELRIKAAPHARDVPAINHPRIFLDRQWMSLEDQRRWFAEAHCFIAASRGEGFGLMPLQAIAMAVPTIVSLSSGQNEFAHLATSTVKCGKTQAETLGRWDEPDMNELKKAMLWHYNNYGESVSKASNLARDIGEFTWTEASRKLASAVPEGRLLKTSTFVECTADVRVEVIKDFKADIGTKRVVGVKGEIIVVTDGQYQVLHDSGHVRLV
jgi:glycosyltransferase involved in cell wall biosynthesis